MRAPIRGDRQATDRYVQRLVLMAQVLDAQGHQALLRTLEGDRDDNPVFHWNETFAKSEALADARRHADSIEVLSSLLTELASASRAPDRDDWACTGSQAVESGAG